MNPSAHSDRYLRKRGSRWHYYRRVPGKYARFDGRGVIRTALGTASLEMARMRRDELAAADEEYWAAMALAEAAQNAGKVFEPAAVERRYRAAQAHAMAAGFKYAPLDRLVEHGEIEDIVARLLAVRREAEPPGEPEPFSAEALLGGAGEPKVTLSEALDLYFDQIAVDAQYNKSDNQRRQWRKVKTLSVRYFIDVVGDLPLVDITREHALAFHRWWLARMSDPPVGEARVKPNTANRHLGNVRRLYSAYFTHIGEEERANPFRNLFFKGKTRTETPSFPDAWVREKILCPGALSGLRRELQLITYMLIETGCRPSEIINLQPEDIRLDAPVPFISIRPSRRREIKTESSVRDIPLVGVSLEAARLAPGGFPHYHDRNELFSANMMKAFRNRGLFPTPDHVIYSFRHSFEKRMQEVNIDYGLRCLLMGHRTDRPAYGDGGGMAYRRDELLKIAHPFDPRVFELIDAEFPQKLLG